MTNDPFPNQSSTASAAATPDNAAPVAVTTAAPGRRKLLRLVLRVVLILAGAVIVVVLAGGIAFRVALQRSLPILEGSHALAGLSSSVRVERDAHGVPTVLGKNRLDVARVTGFLHAQDRFFQMDLMRRGSAGELAELFGKLVLKTDRQARVHRLRERARRVVAAASPEEAAMLRAYADGVNTGLEALGARPFEYILLRKQPEPWKPEDTVLTLLTMFLDLQADGPERESTVGLAHDLLPGPLFDFLDPAGSEWDAPLVGGPIDTGPVPGPDVVDLRTEVPTIAGASGIKAAGRTVPGPWASPANDAGHPDNAVAMSGTSTAGSPARVLADTPDSAAEDRFALGSNNWAVAGPRTADGGALVANDMHLGLIVPNIWYRASLVWPDGAGPARPLRITGITLPGTPYVIVGSNGHVAWGFTNTQGDWSDLVVLDPVPGDADAYMTPDGPKKFEHRSERIHVSGAADETLDVLETVWGPVFDKDHKGRRRALRWVAHDPQAVNLHFGPLESARDLDQALLAAAAAGIPEQNFVAVDSSGRIGWTVAGPIPRRVGFDGRLPGSWADGTRRWDGLLSPEEHPRVVDPPSGRIWTANSRVVDGEMLRAIGDGGYYLGARAKQIRDDLLAIEKATPRDMLTIQLDDRAVFLARWRDLLLRVLTPEACAAKPRRAEARRLVETWEGRASVDSVGYRIVRGFRAFLSDRILASLTAPCRKADPKFAVGYLQQAEGAIWKILETKPAHLLAPEYARWEDACLDAFDSVLDSIAKDGRPLTAHPWGERNTVLVRHPLSFGLPFVGRFLNMPAMALPGDNHMPRIQGTSFGASERMVVSPGREEQGLFHMPCGESGHPLSPHYSDGHAAWVRGEATPFLPGPPVHVLTLEPSGGK